LQFLVRLDKLCISSVDVKVPIPAWWRKTLVVCIGMCIIGW
jgi:hypothetical protein